MNRITVRSKVGSDGVLHLDLPLGDAAADQEVQVTIESASTTSNQVQPIMTAHDLLSSGLVGMWSDRTDIDDNHLFARKLRELAQTRRSGT